MVTLKSQKSRKDINLTQISQIPRIFSGSPSAQNLKKILILNSYSQRSENTSKFLILNS